MSNDRVPLFVRLPAEQAAGLDKLVASTGRRKQQLVSDMLSERLTVGRAEVLEADEAEVLTLHETAELLRVPVEAVRERAENGELPGRRFEDDWRFARAAVIAWLLDGEAAPDARE